VQAWFARVAPEASPYRLYALSNVGSLAALVTYPFFMERLFTTRTQSYLWSGLFILFALLSILLAWRSAHHPLLSEAPETKSRKSGTSESIALPWARVILWLMLPAIAVVALLGVTNHLCRDVAVVPFLWIGPLVVYLLTFIICFDRDRWYVPRRWGLGAVLSTLAIASIMLSKFLDDAVDQGLLKQLWNMLDLNYPSTYLKYFPVESAIYLSWLFFACMTCHGELVRSRPAPRHLTSFYLCVAAGGALGGLFVAVVAPWLFSHYWEFNIAQATVFVLGLVVLGTDGYVVWFQKSTLLRVSAWVAGGTAAFVVTMAHVQALDGQGLVRLRNFYGVITVRQHYEGINEGRALYHGRIMHGFQFTSPERRREPTTYYSVDSGPDVLIRWLRKRQQTLRYGVIGLGTGNMAAFGKEGDYVCFYEIDKDVISLQSQYFTFVKDCPAEVEIVIGDARIKMDSQPPQQFDALFIDAFSGDAIPTHLLTREALQVYLRHMRPGGVLAFHVSNRYLELDPVIQGLADSQQLTCVKVYADSEGDEMYYAASDWILVSSNPDFLSDSAIQLRSADMADLPAILWTDKYSNLFDVLR
jgi:SAM-dependent methyltransferase